MNTESSSLTDFLSQQLPVIDDSLSKQREPLSVRPLTATQMIIEHCILDSMGKPVEDYLETPLFAHLYKLVAEWYNRRYAEAMRADLDHSIIVVVLLYNIPFEIRVPLIFTEIEEVGKTAWIYFPTEVHKQESVLDWFVCGPNIQELSSEEVSLLKNEISKLAVDSRSIQNNISNAATDHKKGQMLFGGIQAHIETAVRNILSQEDNLILNAFWEIHLAVEKSIKLLIQQYGGAVKKTHDLKVLCSMGDKIDGLTIPTEAIERLPTLNETVPMRYGEGEVKEVAEAISNYRMALPVIRTLTAQFKKKSITLNNAKFLIQKLPFV